ncbi:MAG: DNA pilot protein [Microviridae sp.]|nr:MAG: DNA pilot protein [Microviridae sp.]
MPFIEALGQQAASQAVGGILGLALGGINDRRQLKQQSKLQAMQIQGQKEMTDYNTGKQLEMWEKTGYGAQKDQMMRAGLNPALLYGTSGGGGQTANITAGNVSGADAPKGGGEAISGMGMGLQTLAQLQLLKAQKENIEADTELKKTDAAYRGGAQTDNTNADTGLKTSNKESIDLANAMTTWLQGKTPEGEEAGNQGDSIAAQQKKAELNKTQTEAVLNNKKMQEIAASIKLMKKQGLQSEEITNNLKKDGKIKDAEIQWNEMGLTQGDLGKFLNTLIHVILK